jgi:hypothetical protein
VIIGDELVLPQLKLMFCKKKNEIIVGIKLMKIRKKKKKKKN